MKILIAVLGSIILLLSSCTRREVSLDVLAITSSLKAEKTLKIVLGAMEEKDGEALKAVFSQDALNNAENIDDEINSLFEFFQGKVVSWDDDAGLGVDEEFKNGLILRRTVFFVNVTTEEQEYFIYLLEYPIDKEHPNNVGLHTLRVMKMEDEEQFGYWQDNMFPGIKSGV